MLAIFPHSESLSFLSPVSHLHQFATLKYYPMQKEIDTRVQNDVW